MATQKRSDKNAGLRNTAQLHKTIGSQFPKIHTTLQTRHIKFVHMRYDGREGVTTDEGLSCFKGNFKPIRRAISARIAKALTARFKDLLQDRFPKWECGPGARGEIIWTVSEDTLVHQHDVRVVNYKTCTVEGLDTEVPIDRVEAYRLLKCTTGHVTKREAEVLDAAGYNRQEYGWFIHVADRIDPVIPEIPRMSEGLSGVIQYARKHSFAYVLFDRDAEPLPNIRTYNW